MVYEITRDLPLKPVEIETPICQYTGYELAKKWLLFQFYVQDLEW